MLYAVYQNGSYNWLFSSPLLLFLKICKLVLYQPYVHKVIAVVGVPTTATTAELVAVTGIPEVLEVLFISEVFAVTAQPPLQHNLHGIFQH